MRILGTIVIALITLSVNAQTSITIPNNPSPSIDGHVSPGEWDMADSVQIVTTPPPSVVFATIFFQHDADSLYFLFIGDLEGNGRFPEILIDANNSKSAAWEADDWWFHVSGSDCEYQGDHSIYTNCAVVQPDWTGTPNMFPGPPIVDTIEIAIPLSKVGLSIPDTFGIAFDVTNTVNMWEFWPEFVNIDEPSRFGTAYLLGSTSVEPTVAGGIEIGPNPFRETLVIETDEPVLVRMVDLTGKERFRSKTYQRKTIISGADLPIGILMAQLTFADGSIQYKKVIKQPGR